MRYLILLLALLIPCTASAGQAAQRMLAVMKRTVTITANSINGITALDSSVAVTDTGVGYGIGTGAISIPVHCDTTTDGTTTVYLYINGAQADSFSCITFIEDDDTLTANVSGSYTARVYGIKTGSGEFTAGGASTPFVFPVTP